MVCRLKKRRERPTFISEHAWTHWETYCDSDDMKDKSRIARENRKSGSDIPGKYMATHRGGSKCAQQHAIDLAKEKGVTERNMDWELFLRLHRRSNGLFDNDKCTRIAEEVQKKAEELSQPLPGTTDPVPVDMSKIYFDVVGGVSKKKRVYGIGSRSNLYNARGCAAAQFNSHEFNKQVEEMRERLRAENMEFQAQVEARLRAENEQFQAEMKTEMKAEVQEQMVVFCAQFMSFRPSPNS